MRLQIVQCSQFRFVSMYVYIYIYIRHALIVWAWFLWSRPQTTSHVVLVQPNEIVQEPKWNGSRPSVIVLESENENKRTLHQKSDNDSTAVCIFVFRDLHDTSLTSWNSSHDRLATFTAISRPQYLAPTHYTWLQRISTCRYSSAQGILLVIYKWLLQISTTLIISFVFFSITGLDTLASFPWTSTLMYEVQIRLVRSKLSTWLAAYQPVYFLCMMAFYITEFWLWALYSWAWLNS